MFLIYSSCVKIVFNLKVKYLLWLYFTLKVTDGSVGLFCDVSFSVVLFYSSGAVSVSVLQVSLSFLRQTPCWPGNERRSPASTMAWRSCSVLLRLTGEDVLRSSVKGGRSVTTAGVRASVPADRQSGLRCSELLCYRPRTVRANRVLAG